MKSAVEETILRRAKTSDGLRVWSGPVSIYLAVALLVTLPGLGSTGLVTMEGMVVDTAETMLATGDYVVPRLYGEIYSYKPPLLYWTTAFALELGGRSEWTVRLPSALAGFGFGLFLLFAVGRLTGPRTGLFAGLAAVTGILFVQKMKIAEFDAPLAAATGIAITAACYNLAAERSQRSALMWLLGYIGLAAALLIKGVPALMAYLPGLLLAAAVTRRWRQLLSWPHLTAATLSAIPVAIYFWVATDAAGATFLAQPLAEARARGFGWSGGAVLQTLLKPIMVWVLFLPWSLTWLWGLSRPDSAVKRRLLHAGWAFLGAGTLAFMAVPTAESRYYLPLAAGGAIVSALTLERLRPAPAGALRAARLLALVTASVLIGAAFLREFSVGTPAFVLIGGLAALATVILMPRLGGGRDLVVPLLATALCGWVMQTWAIRPRHAAIRDLSPVANQLGPSFPEKATVWTFGYAADIGKNSSLYYYLERPVRTFRAVDELPPEGSHLILTPDDLGFLTQENPGAGAALQPVAQADHPRGRFLLYRVIGDGRPAGG